MPLHLMIENEAALPDGGPISVTVTNRRGIDIGRDQYLDWVLPDPTRFISGKHCEVRYRDGRYWLTDVSTNGTFVNGSEFRIDGAHALKTGDRVEIGRFIIAVTVQPDADEQTLPTPDSGHSGGAEAIWDVGQSSVPSINPQSLRQPSISTGLNALDPLDWVTDIPAVESPSPYQQQGRQAAIDWQWAPPAQAQPSPPAPAYVDPNVPASPAPSPPGRSPDAFPVFGSQQGAIQAMPPMRPDDGEDEEDTGTLQPFTGQATLPAAAVLPTPPLPAPVPAATADVFDAVSEPLQVLQGATGPVRAPQAMTPLQPAAMPPQRAAVPGGFRTAFARGAGVDESIIAQQDEQVLAEMLGVFVRLTADNLRQLHAARAQSKGAMRSSNMTMIQAVDNNPLRFSPTSDEALRILFGPPTSSYLTPQKALESSFHDLKKHQVAVFSAMQSALSQLIEDLDPKKIDAALEQDKGVGSLLRSRQARLWERYETVWKARAGKSDHGMLDVFMRLFSEAYDRT